MPNGTPITDRIIEASIQWAERIMQRIDKLHSYKRMLGTSVTVARKFI